MIQWPTSSALTSKTRVDDTDIVPDKRQVASLFPRQPTTDHSGYVSKIELRYSFPRFVRSTSLQSTAVRKDPSRIPIRSRCPFDRKSRRGYKRGFERDSVAIERTKRNEPLVRFRSFGKKLPSWRAAHTMRDPCSPDYRRALL